MTRDELRQLIADVQ
jgi:ATP-dependent DNA helicase RecG